MSRRQIKMAVVCSAVCAILALLFYLSLPDPLFDVPVSTVLEDRKGNLLGARIAEDGQWRFPLNQNVPDKFRIALLQFEDRRFYAHPGVDVPALCRAIYLNLKSWKAVSGGSTLTMQVIRLSRRGRPRSISEKLIEMLLAVRLECSFSKKEILAFYASNAPFGGNVVGLDAAAWRYFGRKPDDLSWAESAMLAVLPNSPSLIHPGKNREKLRNKRDRLLKRLRDVGVLDEETFRLALSEPIPERPKPFPRYAFHLLERANREAEQKTTKTCFRSTLDIDLQIKAGEIVNRYQKQYAGNQIHNAAALIIEVETGNVLAYIGNAGNLNDRTNGAQVDIITAERSTGSVLKPFLFAGMLTSGDILPTSLVPDIPTQFGGYMPENYNMGYDGAVPAKRALARSLNIPAIRMLRKYGIPKFIHLLKKTGMTTVNKTAEHYGLSLILGGAEGTLWELTGMYASMARSLNHFGIYSGRYDPRDYRPPVFLADSTEKNTVGYESTEPGSHLSAGSIWLTFNAMLDVERPDEESSWKYYGSSERIAWKTGTSFGFRDGWAIGITPRYVVGVWAGNADGEGRPHLTGIATAAPVLFELFDILPGDEGWFAPPFDDMTKVKICRKSGHLATEICEPTDSMWIPESGLQFTACPYHKLIHLDPSGRYRVHDQCEDPFNMIHKPWFILPPAMEWYYKTRSATYQPLPPYRNDCAEKNNIPDIKSMEIIYPKDPVQIYIPIELDGTLGSVVFEVAHRDNSAQIFWYLDEDYTGMTSGRHKMALQPSFGHHTLTLTDDQGVMLTQKFEVISKN